MAWRRYAGFIAIIGVLLFIILGVGTYRTLTAEELQVEVESANLSLFADFDYDAAYQRLSEAVRIRTVSYITGQVPFPVNFYKLHNLLEQRFPLTHKSLNREIIGNFSLLFFWEGTDPDLMPYMLMSHLDVVPVENETLNRWTHEPFAGHIIDGFIYGRGTMDDKLGVCGILEAVEHMLKHGLRPRRSVYLGFGHDEEVNGRYGMSKMVQALKQRDVELLFALDEGGLISIDSIPGVSDPVALIGVTEKGSVDVRLAVQTAGGHSSMPPVPETPIGILSQAVMELEANPMDAHIDAVAMLWGHLQTKLPFPIRFVIRNLWLFKGLLPSVLSRAPATNAAIRTTFAATMMKGSDKRNVIPAEPSMIVNVRVMPGDTIASVERHVRKVINDPRVNISLIMDEGNEPTEISPIDSTEFRYVHKTIKKINPDVYVAPYVMIGGTDSKYLYAITRNVRETLNSNVQVYRFAPFRATKEDLKRFHGINERLSLEDYKRAIHLYYQLIVDADNLENTPQRMRTPRATARHGDEL